MYIYTKFTRLVTFVTERDRTLQFAMALSKSQQRGAVFVTVRNDS